MAAPTDKTYYCPVEITIDLIGGKWKPLILWHLDDGDVLRHGELRRRIPSITQKMLTQQLRQLERDGLVRRRVYAEVPPRVEYALTSYGQQLRPVLQQLCAWGREHADRYDIEIQTPKRADAA